MSLLNPTATEAAIASMKDEGREFERLSAALAPALKAPANEIVTVEMRRDGIYSLARNSEPKNAHVRAIAADLINCAQRISDLAETVITEAEGIETEIVDMAAALRKGVRERLASRIAGFYDPATLRQAVELARCVRQVETQLSQFSQYGRYMLRPSISRLAAAALGTCTNPVPQILATLEGVRSDRAAIARISEKDREAVAA